MKQTESNNVAGKMTVAIEFIDEISKGEIFDNLIRILLQPKYLEYHNNQYTYPIQAAERRSTILTMRKDMVGYNLYMTCRLADSEYYNVDVAIGTAIDMCDKIV